MSANNGIPKGPYSMQYISTEDVIDGIMAHRPGVVMAKLTLRATFTFGPSTILTVLGNKISYILFYFRPSYLKKFDCVAS